MDFRLWHSIFRKKVYSTFISSSGNWLFRLWALILFNQNFSLFLFKQYIFLAIIPKAESLSLAFGIFFWIERNTDILRHGPNTISNILPHSKWSQWLFFCMDKSFLSVANIPFKTQSLENFNILNSWLASQTNRPMRILHSNPHI